MKRTIAIAVVLAAISAGVSGAQQRYDLSVASIGFPTREYQPDAWKINVLKVFNNRLYLGYGDATINTGPTDVIYYDLDGLKFVKEFTVQEEAITQYQNIDGKLVIPGVDATEEWDSGNVYVRNDTGWTKYRSIPNGLHVFDVVPYGGKWFVGTGNYCKLTKDQSFAPGAVLSTTDSCRTWQYEYLSPCDRQAVYRFSALIPFKGRLYTFPYAYTWLPLDSIPPAYRQYCTEPYVEGGIEGYLVSVDNAFGCNNAIVYDGSSWRQTGIIPDSNVFKTRPAVFKDKLLLSAVAGKYIDAPAKYLAKHGLLPGNVHTGLYAFDGTKAARVDFSYELIRDISVKSDTLYILYHDHGRELIAATADLRAWAYYQLPRVLREPRSLEYDSGRFFIGMEDGNIFQSTGRQPAESDTSDNTSAPTSFYGAAEMPRQSKLYWAAITGWQRPGRPAAYSCALDPCNKITLTTENVSEIHVFVGDCGADHTRPLSLSIDGQTVYTGKHQPELVCHQSDRRWLARAGNGNAGTFKAPRVIVGRAAADFRRSGDDPVPGLWQAEILRWAGKADIGLTNKGAIRQDIKEGDVTLNDVYDMNYRNDIRVFRVTGAEILAMMNHNVTRREDRCQIAGFTLTIAEHKDTKNNTVQSCSLDPTKEYSVATTNYVIDEAKDILGREVPAQRTGISLAAATVDWLRANHVIKHFTPTTITKAE